MARFASFSLSVLIALCLLMAFQRTAFAYVDPGSGFVALQTFASVAAAGGYFLRRRIRSLFAGQSAEEQGTAVNGAETVRTKSAGKMDVPVSIGKDTRRPA